MAKASKSKKRAGSAPKVDPYLEGLMAKLLDRLVSLERKLDTVISRTGAKPLPPSGASSAPQLSAAPQQQQQPPQQPRRERMLYEAICADCSKVCEVPFKPSESRPVYCKPCFAKRKAALSDNKFGGVIIKPVALPPRPVDKPLPSALSAPQAASPARAAAKKPTKSKPAKKTKKKK